VSSGFGVFDVETVGSVNGGVDEWAATEDSSVERSVTGVLATQPCQ
jgi:hypothetical protein